MSPRAPARGDLDLRETSIALWSALTMVKRALGLALVKWEGLGPEVERDKLRGTARLVLKALEELAPATNPVLDVVIAAEQLAQAHRGDRRLRGLRRALQAMWKAAEP